LEKDRDVRCQTASELGADLERLKRNRSSGESETIARSMPTNPRGRLQVSDPETARTYAPALGRRWPQIAVSIVLVVVAVAGLARFRSRPSETPRAFQQRRLTASPEDLPIESASISPDGKYLGYSDHRGIYVQLIGTGETQAMPLTPGFQPGRDTWGFAGWYPDSTHFLASLSVPERGPSLWSAPILGGAPKKLVEGVDSGAVSPDGLSIAYLKEPAASGLYHEIWLMGPHGELPHRILTTGDQSHVDNIKWSPASKRIAYQFFESTCVSLDSCDLNGAAKTRILPDSQLISCDWTGPDRIICSQSMEKTARAVGRSWRPNARQTPVLASNLWEQKVDDRTGTPQGRPRRLTDWSGFFLWGISATADGKHLAFLRGTYYQPVLVADLANNGNQLLNPRRLTADEYVNMAVSWTADSREVIFTSNRGGTFGIYKQAMDESNPQIVSALPEMYVVVARLSPDNKWIVFNASLRGLRTEPPSRLYRLAVDGGAAQSILEAKEIDNLDCTNRIANFCVYSSNSEDQRERVFTWFHPTGGKGKELVRIPVEPRVGNNWMLAPDGSKIAFLENGSPIRIKFITLDGGASRTVEVKGDFLRSWSVHWARDSRSIFLGVERADGATLLHIDLKGNAQPIWAVPHRGPIAGNPSPDGHHMVLNSSGSNTNAWLIDNL
jgi:Tol biopolymer transport system component